MIAGRWDTWRSQITQELTHSFTMLTVNADDHRPGRMPRSLEDAFGPGQRPSTTRLYIEVPRRQRISETVATAVSVLAGLFVIALLISERIAS